MDDEDGNCGLEETKTQRNEPCQASGHFVTQRGGGVAGVELGKPTLSSRQHRKNWTGNTRNLTRGNRCKGMESFGGWSSTTQEAFNIQAVSTSIADRQQLVFLSCLSAWEAAAVQCESRQVFFPCIPTARALAKVY